MFLPRFLLLPFGSILGASVLVVGLLMGGRLEGAPEPLVPCVGDQPCMLDELKQLGVNIFNFLLAVGGAAALLAIIVAGLKYITGVLQGADSAAIGEAKKNLTYAIMGLLVLLLAFVIVHTIVATIFQTKPEFTSPAL